MKNKLLITCLVVVLSFMGYNIYSVINNTMTAQVNLNAKKIEYEVFKSENVNYDYKDIVDFSKRYTGVKLKSVKNSKDSILANFYFNGDLEALNTFLQDVYKIPNLSGLNNINLEKVDNISYKGEIASEFIKKFN
ncbi:MAG: hypothetical protein FWC47_05970 [Oscillospiraceae bacterium]|nr:hypothetical protein [Oscillospiraceae bacterium]